MTRFGVITKVCEPTSGGNLAMGLGHIFVDPQATGGKFDDEHRPLHEVLRDPMLSMFIQIPVFRVGEILIFDANDRDQFGRKPSKWDVTCERFDTIDEATRRVIEVTDDH